ncbi:BlaI/MecI/CopY family transcriptional regulator [Rhodococcus antarcticus]|jgi:predicted transcriptional regulator|uniref:BlaI/MecI/CopY family transcriptional regulator n=1 Tax=Rhodococcus antarcticus TaxID=2987751 RepID=A0ABY6P0W4_9NOCA|nr:BlaI/MecI/CopY family transcriptional regulator [Rhodococcus antarcticus]UZJ25173.1 BlaI/MecI/CopY family transcriptional regulator [Rhodococcus antarcticus]
MGAPGHPADANGTEKSVTGLGELEAAVMQVLWDSQEPRSVRDVLDSLNEERSLAYTTVLTVLDNLHRKEWVAREKVSRAFLYRAVETRDQAAARALRVILDGAGDTEAVLLHFARTVSPGESIALRQALAEGSGQ